MENLNDIRDFYEKNVYGRWRSGEKVSWTVLEKSRRVVVPDPKNPFLAMFKLSTDDEGKDVEIHVEKDGKTAVFTVRAYLPAAEAAKAYENGCPFIVCMHPVMPKQYLLDRGCALIFMDTSEVAEDNNLRRGGFYELYPYTSDPETQTGELMAWSWAASKVLDAVYGGLDGELGLNAEMSAVTGVSRWGKATAVCGAFEKRFKVVIPVCSGAGGLALWNYCSEGKHYNLEEYGGPADYVYGKNEPLDCLQSEAEQGWFNDAFLQYGSYADIPVEQYMLPVLAAGKDRWYFIVGAMMGEDWVNAPAMRECYKKAASLYAGLGLGDRIFAHFHKEGHAILEEDLEYIISVLSPAKA